VSRGALERERPQRIVRWRGRPGGPAPAVSRRANDALDSAPGAPLRSPRRSRGLRERGPLYGAAVFRDRALGGVTDCNMELHFDTVGPAAVIDLRGTEPLERRAIGDRGAATTGMRAEPAPSGSRGRSEPIATDWADLSATASSSSMQSRTGRSDFGTLGPVGDRWVNARSDGGKK
jgi:hypothetical protein